MNAALANGRERGGGCGESPCAEKLRDRERAAAAARHRDGNGLPEEAAWIDLATPTPRQEQLVEASLRIEIPTRAEAGGIQSSDRLVNADGTLYTSALVPAGPHVTTQTIPLTFVRTGKS